MRAPFVVLTLLVLTARGSAATEPPPVPLPSVSFAGASGSPALRAALAELARACEAGDRAAFVSLAPPARRAAAQSLADALVSRPNRPLHGVRIEVISVAAGSKDAQGAAETGHLLLHARGDAGSPPDLPPVPEGFARAEAGTRVAALGFETSAGVGGRVHLELTAEYPATVAHADLEIRLDPKPPRARSRATLTLDSAPRVALLPVGSGASVRAAREGLVLTPIEQLLGSGEAAVRVEWSGTPDGPDGIVAVEADVPIPDSAVKSGVVTLLHQMQAVPFTTGGHFRFDLVLDVPLPNRSVSVGTATELPAPEGRRRTRWTCDRAVDYLPLAAGPYQIATQGEGAGRLELWRTRSVGGDAQAILSELRELVSLQERDVAPLPYRAFRLVELPTTQGLAVSYASMIFMTPDLLATREQRIEILSHEVGHQWWGNAVSPHPTARWAAEGMADAMKDLFVLERFGRERFLDRQDSHRTRLLGFLGATSRPLADDPGGLDAYDRGALFVHALKAELGDEIFWAVLKRWFAALSGAQPATRDFRREAEAGAGRPLGAVFDPWLSSTALPVVRMSWTSDGTEARVVLEQDDPPFPLSVPLRASAGSDRIHEWTMRLDGLRAEASLRLPFVPDAIDLDPGRLLPRVLPGELPAYLRAEAASCLSRGDAARARRLLEEASARSLPDVTVAGALYSARVLDGVPPAAARKDLDVVLAEQPDDARRQVALMEVADDLMEQGAAAAALPLLQALDADVHDGASIPRRLGLALRALGREAEAQAAFQRALQRRPGDDATHAALGLPPIVAAAAPGDSAGSGAPKLEPLLPADDPLLAASSPEGTHAVALPGGRFAVLLSGARALLTGRAGAMRRVEGFSPAGAAGIAVLAPASQSPMLAVLEGSRQAGRLTILDMAADGTARVVARHERTPGGARAIAAGLDGSVLAAWPGAGESWEWWRFTAPLRAPSTGPDDDDGLRRIVPKDDARWTPVASAPEAGAAIDLRETGFVSLRDAGSRLASDTATAWELLGRGQTIRAAHPFRDGIAIVVQSTSPGVAAEDRKTSSRLIAVAGDLVVEQALPDGAIDAWLAADGGLVVELETRDRSEPRLRHGIVDSVR